MSEVPPMIDAITYFASYFETFNLSRIPATYFVTLCQVITVWAMTSANPSCPDIAPACFYGVARGFRRAFREERYLYAQQSFY